jgi:polysaccharide chain length determinant protein (PEP-CTERM system associated)
MNLQVGNVDLNAVLAIVRRRLWFAAAVGSFVIVVIACLAFFLPKVYSASALLLIEGKEVSSDFIRSPGSVSVETRLGTISQEVLSNARLEKLVKDFQLDRRRSPQSLEDTIERVRKAIQVDVIEGGREGAIAFSISFSGADSQKVTDITNALASFYVERNAMIHERQASGVANALQAEADQMKQRLEEQERQIQQYKDRYTGELPEQLDANSKAADRLHDRIQTLTDEIARKRDRRAILVSQTASGEAEPNGSFSALDILTDRIATLRQELADLRTRYSEKYPDVEQTKRELEALEERLKFRSKRVKGESNGERWLVAPGREGAATQLRELNAEIARMEGERKKLQQQLNEYQKRIDNTSKRELGLQSLTRDYNALREKYSSLVGRQEEAKLASRQKGEQFRILDPATYPISPLGPRRFHLLLAAFVLGLGAALGSVVAWEKFIDTSFHNAAELENATKIPVLVAIPRMAATWEHSGGVRGQAVYIVSFILLLIVVGGAVRYFAANNTGLALKLSSKPANTSK